MIKTPFIADDFAREMKPKISGMNLSLEYFNIESSLMKTAAKIPATISKAQYVKLCEYAIEKNMSEVYHTAVDYLQRAMLHFAINEHLIYLTVRVSNDGITTKKNDDETTAYKYQTNDLSNDLITTAWFWMNQLIAWMNDHLDDFPEWKESDERNAYEELPVDINDFNKWVGVELAGGEAFMVNIAWIIREVWNDCVCSRFKDPEKTDAIARAVCYDVMGRACERLAYYLLPYPIRYDVNTEMGKNHAAQADKDIRERVAGKFVLKAKTYWNNVDMEIKQAEMEAQRATAADRPIVGEKNIKQSDKFYY